MMQIDKTLSTEIYNYLQAHSELCQTSKMERFANVHNGWMQLTIFANCSILDIWQDSKYASDLLFFTSVIFVFGIQSNLF